MWCRPARVEVERAQRVAGANGITTSEIVVEDPYEMVYSMYKSGYFHHALVRGLRERKRSVRACGCKLDRLITYRWCVLECRLVGGQLASASQTRIAPIEIGLDMWDASDCDQRG